jgi:hypothetical protein
VWRRYFQRQLKRVVFFAEYCSIKSDIYCTCVRLQILKNGSALYRIKNRQHRVHTVNNNITFLSVFLLPYINCILKRNILTAITEIRKTWI